MTTYTSVIDQAKIDAAEQQMERQLRGVEKKHKAKLAAQARDLHRGQLRSLRPEPQSRRGGRTG
jgi:hypothetical protein